jgi:hypothetical protein
MTLTENIVECLPKKAIGDKGCGDDVWDNLTKETSVHEESYNLCRSEVIAAIPRILKAIKEEIENRYGKKGTFTGSLGYQGIMQDIHAFQTERDIMRDDILTLLTPEK